MRKVLVMLLIVALGGVSAYAQQNQEERRQRMEEMNKRIATDLKLDEKQTADFKQINDKYQKKMDEQRASMQGGQVDRDAMRETMQKMNEERNADMKKIMTDEQFKKYQEAMQNQMRNFGGGQRNN